MPLFNKIEWQRRTDQKKAESICTILQLPTHNGVTKDDLIMMLDWIFHKVYECDHPCKSYTDRCTCLKVLKGGAE